MEWTGARYSDAPTAQAQTWIDAPPHRVWELVSDIELMPSLSNELESVIWLDRVTQAAVGARLSVAAATRRWGNGRPPPK